MSTKTQSPLNDLLGVDHVLRGSEYSGFYFRPIRVIAGKVPHLVIEVWRYNYGRPRTVNSKRVAAGEFLSNYVQTRT